MTTRGNGSRNGARRVPPATEIRIPKAAELVAAHIRRQIVRGELCEGDALLPESALMAQYGVSRPTLREAFRVLETEALIKIKRGAHGGAQVQSPSGEVAARYAALVLQYRGTATSDLYIGRSLVESPCAGILAARSSPSTVSALNTLLAQTRSMLDDPTDRLGGLTQSMMDFHSRIVELTGNQTLIVLCGMFDNLIGAASDAFSSSQGDVELFRTEARKGHRAHERLVELIEHGDEPDAIAHWKHHLVTLGQVVPAASGASSITDVLERT